MNTYNSDKMYKSYSGKVGRMQKCINDLQQENQQLKNVIEEYERLNKENGRGFKITSVKQYNIDELIRYKDNWNKLKNFLKNTREEHLELDKKHNCGWKGYNAYSELLIKIQELERGVDDEQR